ncbi:MAG: hypothetical protein WCX32_00125 [Clostridia bacterium]|jgi:hypothetical protein|nr:hypothetical protein [Clostridia bacterium]MDD4275974.1 hypothetical protein [Clostridia bacterium]
MNYYVFLTENNAGSPIKFLKNVNIDNNEDERTTYENMKGFWLRIKDYFLNHINTASPKNVEYYKYQLSEFLNIACHEDVLSATEEGFWYPYQDIENAIINSRGRFTEIPEYKILKCIKDEAVIYSVFEKAIKYCKNIFAIKKAEIDESRKLNDSAKRSKTDYASLEYTDYAFKIEEIWIKTRNMIRFVMYNFEPLNMKDSRTVCAIFENTNNYDDILAVCTQLFESIQTLNLKRLGKI